ncbi:hypothetical protein D046_3981D, partial [Vibrio parahaemolyticus V-223/04]
TCRPT